ncbi:hypothetical protein SAMN05660909_02152 [Chitinophaga terrae (ex Kim and Jung 2007)]|jgi:hypothetical protein|uniref:YtxH domain-containing protein n=1 Tax=Chitinophaga terrae (ex Kim and Jung 2007) TaxID=408074 RepID=A0A1H4BM05_9BACT|nr:hypothetical protein [Chitinophaga terrae (ex Kim and Jung 2007)]SEA49078.1 hypothetical protein SAMN05660909_02152 [Chitinophaga terrae (ex Kim and Jung 2007)]
MKKTVFILFTMLFAGTMVHAQLLPKLKTKTITAVNSSTDRAADKVVDKAVSKTSDDVTDKAIGKAEDKIRNLFKKKRKKPVDPGPSVLPVTDSAALKPHEPVPAN